MTPIAPILPKGSAAAVRGMENSLNRADTAIKKTFDHLQSISEGSRTGSTQLEHELKMVSKSLVSVSNNIGKTGNVEVVAAMPALIQGANMLNQVASEFHVEPRRQLRPEQEASAISSISGTLTAFEQILNGVRNVTHLGPASVTPRQPNPSPEKDLRLMKWISANQYSNDLSKYPKDLADRYSSTISSLTDPYQPQAAPPEEQGGPPAEQWQPPDAAPQEGQPTPQ